MYISKDDGASWKKFQLNLPIVPITDLAIKDNDLIVATQGRSIYVLDDLTILQEMNKEITNKDLHVFPVNPAYRMTGSPFASTFGAAPRNAGANPPRGAVINYYAKNVADTTKASISILDKNRKLIRTYSTDARENADKMQIDKGLNQFVWNLQHPGADRVEGMILWNGTPGVITTAPGAHYAKIRVGKDSIEVPFEIKQNPNYKISAADYEAQMSFLTQVRDKFNEVQKGIKDIRAVRGQINELTGRWGKETPKEVKQFADSINKKLTAIEETLYQTKSKSGQDPLNFPIRLNDKLSGLFDVVNSGNMAPSKQSKEVFADLSAQSDAELAKLKQIMTDDLVKLNQLIREKSLPVIGVKKDG